MTPRALGTAACGLFGLGALLALAPAPARPRIRAAFRHG